MLSALITNCPTIFVDGAVAFQYIRNPYFEDCNPIGRRFQRVRVFLPASRACVIDRAFDGRIDLDWTLVERGSEIRFFYADGSGCVFRVI